MPAEYKALKLKIVVTVELSGVGNYVLIKIELWSHAEQFCLQSSPLTKIHVLGEY